MDLAPLEGSWGDSGGRSPLGEITPTNPWGIRPLAKCKYNKTVFYVRSCLLNVERSAVEDGFDDPRIIRTTSKIKLKQNSNIIRVHSRNITFQLSSNFHQPSNYVHQHCLSNRIINWWPWKDGRRDSDKI